MAIAYFFISGVVLLGLATFAVDLGYIVSVKSELHASVDAACLAAASGLPVSPAEARNRAKAIGASNTVNGQPLTLQDTDIELGSWNASANEFTKLNAADENKATAIRITGRLSAARGNQINLVFGPILGFRNKELTVSSIVGFAQAADLVIVQDITSSFAAELSDAKQGDQALLDALHMDGQGRSSLGIVVFTGWGQTISPLLKINTNYGALSSDISSVNHCGSAGMPICSGTDISAGLEQGIAVFNDPSYPSTSPTGKVIVLVSDGEPTQNSQGSNPALNDVQLMTRAEQKADEAWAQGIHVYVVFFNRDNSATAAANLDRLKRGRGDFVSVTDANQLPVALEEITRKLPTALVR
jgi:Flp pilus assembly protein TadG